MHDLSSGRCHGHPAASLLTGLGVDESFARTDTLGTSILLTDALSSTVALTDAAGVVQTQYTYEPFGATVTTGTASSNPVQYTGRENDGPGLYYYRARYYHRGFARFLGEDPIGLAAGDVNFYAYVADNPLNFLDPLGLDNDQCPAGGGVLAGAANLSAGFGDIITSGLGAIYLFGLPSGTEAIRNLWLEAPALPTSGAPDVVNPKCSWAYTAGQVAGAADAIAIVGVGAVRGVQPGGFLNANRNLRFGFGRHGGEQVFRIAGRWVERITGRSHINLWRGGPL